MFVKVVLDDLTRIVLYCRQYLRLNSGRIAHFACNLPPSRRHTGSSRANVVLTAEALYCQIHLYCRLLLG
ncbi:unnamed protein product [Cylicostephanus goldi]|uniref:Uncharacterized protein n=1 Tax=Cylicostephanus goldi TaxID=71465 RepID=A0A3P7NHB7_CYLGO|nr:unnamed protein product [Cylicostephanus goldi]